MLYDHDRPSIRASRVVRALRRAGPWALALAVQLGALGAHAQQAESSWRERFDRARSALIDEHFVQAQAQLEALAQSAPSDADRRLAIELADLARDSERRRTAPPALQPSLRTNDELAVLYTTAVLYGLGTSGWLTLQLQPKTFGSAVLPFALLTSAAVGGVAIADSYRPLRHGIPHAIAAGLYLGFGEGLWLVAYEHARATSRSDLVPWHAERVSTALWAGATAGAVVGGVIGAWRRPTPGRVSFTASAGIWLGLLSAFGAEAINPARHDRAQISYLVGDIGYNAGLLTGILIGPEVAPSVTRMRFVDLGGLGGALLGAGGYALATNQTDSRGEIGAAAIGGALGLGLTWWATSSMPADRSHDILPSALGSASGVPSTLRPVLVPTRGGLVAALVGAL